MLGTKDNQPPVAGVARSQAREKNSRQQTPGIAMHPQTKLTVGEPDDVYERQADAVADKVIWMPDQNFVQRKCAACEKEEEKVQRQPLAESITPFIQTKSAEGGAAVSGSLAQNIQSPRGSGQSIDSGTQSFMASRFGSDFGNVKIHTGDDAIQMNRELHAKAFTVGSDIYFNEAQYRPATPEGKHLLAHELTHTLQQGQLIRRRPLTGSFSELIPEDEEAQYKYYKEEIDFDFTVKHLFRMDKGELDDRDLANWRLMNRINGLTTAEVNALITKITAWQAKNSAISTTKILEYLEVRKSISTPMPAGATVSRDPLTQAVESYSFSVNNVFVRVVTDTFGNAGNDTGTTTNLGKNYSWKSNNKGIVTELINTENGGRTPVNPTSLQVTILTRYKDSPDGSSGYGKGTTAFDQEEKTTTLRVHEGQHGSDYIDYIRKTAFPVDISKGIVGVITATQMRQIDKYISDNTKASCELTDQVGFTQDEFLKTPAGKTSGITSCRKP
jgi:hypothetical protein